MNKILVIDCHALCHYVKHSMMSLGYRGEDTGIIYGFFNQLFLIQRRFRADQWIFAWDSSTSKRKDIYPEYKANRLKILTEEEKEINERSYIQFTKLRDFILFQAGFKNVFYIDGYEADDIIASVCINSSRNKKKIIVSRDKDLWQLLREDVKVYDYQKKKSFTEEDFIHMWGIFPRQWVRVKQIAGCDGDNIKGVKGVGESTAVKYLKGILSRGKKFSDIQAHQELIDFNEQLIKLPLPGTPKFHFQNNQITTKRLHHLFRYYGFQSFSEDLNEWGELFGRDIPF